MTVSARGDLGEPTVRHRNRRLRAAIRPPGVRARSRADPSFGSALGLVVALSAAALGLESADEGAEADGKPFVAVVDPDICSEGDQGREAVGRQRPEERVESAPGRGVPEALLVDGGGAAEGVVVEQGEGQAGFPWGGGHRRAAVRGRPRPGRVSAYLVAVDLPGIRIDDLETTFQDGATRDHDGSCPPPPDTGGGGQQPTAAGSCLRAGGDYGASDRLPTGLGGSRRSDEG